MLCTNKIYFYSYITYIIINRPIRPHTLRWEFYVIYPYYSISCPYIIWYIRKCVVFFTSLHSWRKTIFSFRSIWLWKRGKSGWKVRGWCGWNIQPTVVSIMFVYKLDKLEHKAYCLEFGYAEDANEWVAGESPKNPTPTPNLPSFLSTLLWPFGNTIYSYLLKTATYLQCMHRIKHFKGDHLFKY